MIIVLNIVLGDRSTISKPLVEKHKALVFAKLTVVCCEDEVRRELDSYILQFYLDELERLMREEGEGRKLPFTIENLRPPYEIASVHMTTWLISVIPFFADVGLHEQ